MGRGCVKQIGGLVFPRPTSGQMTSFEKLVVVYRPKGAKFIFETNKAFVQTQISPDGILQGKNVSRNLFDAE